MFFPKLFSSLKNLAVTMRNPVKDPGSATTVAQNHADEHVVQISSPKLECAGPASTPLGLSLLHEPCDNHKADIIFIHGLFGSSSTTWCKNHDPACSWPKEWLPCDVDTRSARLFTYDYETRLECSRQNPLFGISEVTRNLLHDLAFKKGVGDKDFRLGEVPMIFVAHSLGGLVFKKAYLEAQLDARYQHVVNSTKAVVFLATPHRGSDMVILLRRLLSISLPLHGKRIGSKLAENRFLLRQVNEQFQHVAPNLQIFSFFESLKTSLRGMADELIVDYDSAKLGLPGEVCRSLNTDHQGMSKFNSPQDSNYKAVLGALGYLVSSCEQECEH